MTSPALPGALTPAPLASRVREAGRTVRHRITVAGVVQGVGFRPFVHRLASELWLAGYVGNDTGGVFVEVEGSETAVGSFESRLASDAPPLARVERVEAESLAVLGESGFRIVESKPSGAVRTFVSPDVATCDDCVRELFEPTDRRYRYPFVNCTNCGPRFTITVRLPYDRPNTTMAGFTMCGPCSAEYRDTADRRFHAQPIACEQCGPRIRYENAEGTVEGTDRAVAAVQEAFAAGQIVAVKGLGGYHLACDATSEPAVRELRKRKGRSDKPFAVMTASLDSARRFADLTADEARVLASPARPIVLVGKRAEFGVYFGRQCAFDEGALGEGALGEGALGDYVLAAAVAPGNPCVGLMLAYTPIHHLLFARGPESPDSLPEVLVMTSGNLSEEPICYDDADARSRLAGIADGWLVHDRPIHVPCDDSVVRIDSGEQLPIRRSRGFAPLPVKLPIAALPTLATGGELKNAFCVAEGHDAWMSQHIGDMGSIETLDTFERSVEQFSDVYGVRPVVVAADAHPLYQARVWAERYDCRSVATVQHHHAHVASAMAEAEVAADEEVIGFAFDGTGYGEDGAIWGGEMLLAGYRDYTRLGHLRYVPLPGGDAAIRKPYRAALAQLWALDIPWDERLGPVAAAPPGELKALRHQLESGFGCIPTSSMGRLFDVVSSILGVRQTVSFEAQAATELEAVAVSCRQAPRCYRFELQGVEWDHQPVLKAVVADLLDGCGVEALASGFHHALATLVGDAADAARSQAGIDRVVLSGGVFQNVLLLRLAREELLRRDFRVITHRLVPPNDGGLALGQVVVAAARTHLSDRGRASVPLQSEVEGV